jgi:hypothetical protein
MSKTQFFRQVKSLPNEIGLDGVGLDAERTSTMFDLQGVTCLSVFVKHTYNAATRIDVNLDMAPEGMDVASGSSTWCKSQSATIVTGTATLAELDVQKATGSASGNYEVRFTDLNAFKGRLRISSTGGNGSDLAYVTIIRGSVN